MDILLEAKHFKSNQNIRISGSKSETNRLRLLQVLYPELTIQNASDSDDSRIMLQCLQSKSSIKDVHHAGTAMRFLTAYYAMQENNDVILTGSQRMQERPIHILVDALRSLGADISYQNQEGFPPLLIKGKKLHSQKLQIPANISSQYISALLLIAPKLENGLQLELISECTSLPYIKMTLALLNEIGVKTSFSENTITVFPQPTIQPKTITVESDWSSVSYFYELIAFSEIGTTLHIQKFKQKSLQADRVVVDMYEKYFGIQTQFLPNDEIQITKISNDLPQSITIHCIECPDIAQTLAVTCFGLGIEVHLTGLHTLKIKETDRLQALKNELEKVGAQVDITHDSLLLHPRKVALPLAKPIAIATYQDHRMAMCFAPLALKTPLIINEADVVTKSFVDFWPIFKTIVI